MIQRRLSWLSQCAEGLQCDALRTKTLQAQQGDRVVSKSVETSPPPLKLPPSTHLIVLSVFLLCFFGVLDSRV